MNNTSKIKVTIITGFLGAGKTTFINFLLKKYSEKQFALVENEFGDVSIDTKLIKGVNASKMFELKQGCICCTISDEFELVLQELAERFPNVEHLLIETTGVADPALVIRPFFSDQNLKKLFSYNGTICMVDAINFRTQPERETSIKQIAAADLVLINKIKNISKEEILKLTKEVEQINPFCKIIISGIKNLEHEIFIDQISQKERLIVDFPRTKSDHLKLETKTKTYKNPLKREDFTQWLSYILDVHKSEIYRTKGILCFENEPFEYILQGVGGSFEIIESEHFVDNSTISKIILIGRLENVDLSSDFV